MRLALHGRVITLCLMLSAALLWLMWTLRQKISLLTTLRARAVAIENAACAEKNQLSHELHDEIGQKLIALKLQMGLAHHSVHPAGVAGATALLDEIIEDVRALSHSLRPAPFDEGQLIPALAALARTEAGRGGLSLLVDAPNEDMNLRPEVEVTCYRIAREALNNVIKHAGAQHVAVSVECEGEKLAVRVSDDGRGFDVAPMTRLAVFNGRLGIVGMQERAGAVGGTVEISSRPGEGTMITCRVPMLVAA